MSGVIQEESSSRLAVTRPEGELLALRSPGFIEGFSRVFWPFARLWFRARVSGLERLPPGPVLLVGNHSGAGFGEIGVMLSAWWRHFGDRRRGVALAHAFFRAVPGVRQIVERCGGLLATPENGRAALRAGLDVLVFPGGDLDVLRPFRDRRRVIFAGRAGFIAMAEAQGVPIVPVVTTGSHAQYLFLPGGQRIARWLGLDRRLRLKTLPLWPSVVAFLGLLVSASLGFSPWHWALLALVVAIVPNPVPIHVRFCEPLDVSDLLRESDGDRERAAERVRALLESELRRS